MKLQKKLHVIGICGMGTSATAVLMHEHGWCISGSDGGRYEPIASYLNTQGIQFFDNFATENIPHDVDMIMVGTSAALNHESNPEVLHAQTLGVPIRTFAEILGDLSRETENIIVAGSYGKSTCTALLAHIFETAKLSPSYLTGGIPLNSNKTSQKGESNYFIIEGDEYPHHQTEMKSKFMFYNPHDVLLTSAEHDHINRFPTEESYLHAYKEFISTLPKDGLLIYAHTHPHTSYLATQTVSRSVSYGIEDGEYYANNIKYNEITSFDIYKNNDHIGTFCMQVLGSHNIENIIGCVALCLEKNIISIDQLQNAIASFKGVARRLDKKSENTRIPIYEGFGSSYTKAKTAIQAIKLHFPKKDIITIFEPHTFGWRNIENIHWYDNVFNGSKSVLVYKPGEHGSSTQTELTQKQILDHLSTAEYSAVGISSEKECFDYLDQKITNNSIILILTSGTLDGMTTSIPKYIEEKFPKEKIDD